MQRPGSSPAHLLTAHSALTAGQQQQQGLSMASGTMWHLSKAKLDHAWQNRQVCLQQPHRLHPFCCGFQLRCQVYGAWMKRLRRKENIGNSRPTRISFGTTVWCKAILFVLPSNYETQMPVLHMELGFASEPALDSHKHLVYRQHTFLSQKVSWHYNVHQHNHTAVSDTSNTNETANFATQLCYFFITARKPSLLSNKSMDRKHVTLPQVKESYLEDAGNLPPAAAWRWKGRISSQTGHAFLGPLFLGRYFCLTSFFLLHC